jgi:hypothetical protein
MSRQPMIYRIQAWVQRSNDLREAREREAYREEQQNTTLGTADFEAIGAFFGAIVAIPLALIGFLLFLDFLWASLGIVLRVVAVVTS